MEQDPTPKRTIIKPVGKLFPNLTQRVASYDPATQITIFEQMDLERFQHVTTTNLLAKENIQDSSVIVHENRHCIDHLGTLWGQNYLLKLQRALTATLENQNDLESIIEYKKEENRAFQNSFYIQFPEEYTPRVTGFAVSTKEIDDPAKYVNKGKYGAIVQFVSSERHIISELPLSVVSLLEANAVFEEVMLNILATSDLEKDDNLVDNWTYYNKIKDESQIPGLHLYNVITQIAFSLLSEHVFPMNHLIASALSTLALNLPAYLIKQLPLEEGHYEGQLSHAQQLLDDQDYGFAYYVLCRNYSKIFKFDKGVESYSLDDVLDANNLPKKEDLLVIIENEFNIISNNMKELRFKKRFLHYNSIGLSILRSGLDGINSSAMDKFREAKWQPPIATNDFRAADYMENMLAKIDTEEDNIRHANFWYSVVFDLDMIMNERIKSESV